MPIAHANFVRRLNARPDAMSRRRSGRPAAAAWLRSRSVPVAELGRRRPPARSYRYFHPGKIDLVGCLSETVAELEVEKRATLRRGAAPGPLQRVAALATCAVRGIAPSPLPCGDCRPSKPKSTGPPPPPPSRQNYRKALAARSSRVSAAAIDGVIGPSKDSGLRQRRYRCCAGRTDRSLAPTAADDPSAPAKPCRRLTLCRLWIVLVDARCLALWCRRRGRPTRLSALLG